MKIFSGIGYFFINLVRDNHQNYPTGELIVHFYDERCFDLVSSALPEPKTALILKIALRDQSSNIWRLLDAFLFGEVRKYAKVSVIRPF